MKKYTVKILWVWNVSMGFWKSQVQEVPAFRDFWFQRVIKKCGDHEFWGLFLVCIKPQNGITNCEITKSPVIQKSFKSRVEDQWLEISQTPYSQYFHSVPFKNQGIILAIHQKIAGIISIPRSKERRHKHWRQNRIQPAGLSLWGKEPLSNDHKTAVTIEELWYPFLSTLTLEVSWILILIFSTVRPWDTQFLGKYRSKFWHLWRKPAVIFSKWLFFQNSLLMSWPE